MKTLKIIALAIGAACILAGCQTRITAEKNAEQVLPLQKLERLDGTNYVLYTTGYATASGGWYATARSPLWATEDLKGLSLGVHTNGSVTLALDDYHRDLSTNAVVMTQTLADGAIKLTEKVAAAIVTSGGSVAATSTQSAIATLVSKYLASGGDAENATVTCKDGNCTITDGNVTCADGVCSPSEVNN